MLAPGLTAQHNKEHAQKLVNIKKVIPTIALDIRYATSNNFTKHILYSTSSCYVLQKTATQLACAQAELAKEGLGLKIFDGFRPLATQHRMWDLIHDERYVSNPSKGGGRHTRGTTVDVTLVDQHGNELPMGTPFDDFSEKAWHACADLPQEVLNNRKKLCALMEKHGFKPIKTEWWHYDLADWDQHPVLDVDLELMPG